MYVSRPAAGLRRTKFRWTQGWRGNVMGVWNSLTSSQPQ
eukprot:COSAG04_NODE_19432_length_416_cov_1.132492_1_plen_38_part_10